MKRRLSRCIAILRLSRCIAILETQLSKECLHNALVHVLTIIMALDTICDRACHEITIFDTLVRVLDRTCGRNEIEDALWASTSLKQWVPIRDPPVSPILRCPYFPPSHGPLPMP